MSAVCCLFSNDALPVFVHVAETAASKKYCVLESVTSAQALFDVSSILKASALLEESQS